MDVTDGSGKVLRAGRGYGKQNAVLMVYLKGDRNIGSTMEALRLGDPHLADKRRSIKCFHTKPAPPAPAATRSLGLAGPVSDCFVLFELHTCPRSSTTRSCKD